MVTSTDEAEPLTDEEITRALDGEQDQTTAQAQEATTGGDPDAPYGRFANGNPRKYPAGANGHRPGRKRPPRAPRSKPARKPSARGPDYEGIIGGLLQAISIPLMAISPLDVVAIADHGPNLAKAAAITASERPEVAGLLDKLSTIGPYSLLLGAVAPLLTQVLTNHGVIPPLLGAQPRERMADRARAMFAAMRDRGAHDAPAV